MERQRNNNIDLIKFIAIFMVILLHFFVYTGFYDLNRVDSISIISFILKQIAVICVPLFMMTTGYLMNKKEVSKKYFNKLLNTILTYVVISVICMFFLKYILCEQISFFQLIMGVFTFKTIKYSWYINMYIGLYLLLPFLNIIVDRVKENKRIFIYLIILLSMFTSIPKFYDLWYWGKILYPINYYFIGAYFKYYSVDIKKYWFLIIFICILFTELLISIVLGMNFHVFSDNNIIFNLIKSVSVFSFFLSLKIDNNIIIQKISRHTLSIYLVSFIIDSLVYKYFNMIFITYKIRFFNIYIVFIIFILSIFFALFIDFIIGIMIKKIFVSVGD
ncbi:acyltransferase [Thomasclavelia cocleata]|uniref:acyltransferase n=1 Tax=Thomasclavelia cocleata TaxID=69824 RepID=UPI003314608F